MKIFIICSKAFYGKVEFYKKSLEEMGHKVFLPNCKENLKICCMFFVFVR